MKDKILSWLGMGLLSFILLGRSTVMLILWFPLTPIVLIFRNLGVKIMYFYFVNSLVQTKVKHDIKQEVDNIDTVLNTWPEN